MSADDDQVKVLFEDLTKDDWTAKTLSRYYLLEAYYYTKANLSGIFDDKINKAISKARIFVDSAQHVSQKEVIDLRLNQSTQDAQSMLLFLEIQVMYSYGMLTIKKLS